MGRRQGQDTVDAADICLEKKWSTNPVIIDQKNLILYWLSEPVRGHIADGWIDLSHIPFPDLTANAARVNVQR